MVTQQSMCATYPPPRPVPSANSSSADDTSPKSPTVLLTGDLGVVGGWLAVALLERGYRVRLTLRSLAAEDAVRAEIRRSVSADERLSFVAADLQRNIGWDDAAADCDLLLHVAAANTRDTVAGVLRAAELAGIGHVSLASLALAAPRVSDASTGGWTDIAPPARQDAATAMSLFRWLAPSFAPVALPVAATRGAPAPLLVSTTPALAA